MPVACRTGATATRSRRSTLRIAATVLISLLIAVGLGVWAVTHGAETLAAARSLPAPALLLACGCATAGALIAAQAWRSALAGLGGSLPAPAALRICLVGQLGKYVPGSLWPALVQAELARRHGVAPAVTVAAFVLSLVASLAAGAVAAALVLLIGTDRLGGMSAVAVPVVVVLAGVFAGLVAFPGRLVRLVGLVTARRSGAGVAPRPPGPAVRSCLALSLLGWTVTGLHVWVLAVAIGADPLTALPAAVGGLALATVLGSLVVVSPGGLGAREVALVAVLSTVLPLPAAAAVAAASRLLTLLAECSLAALATVLDRAPGHHPVPTVEGAAR